LRRLALAVAALTLVLVAARLALDPYASWRTRRALAALPGTHATFGRVEVDVLALSYAVHGLRLERRSGGRAAALALEVGRARVRLAPRDLLRGRLVARVYLDAPRLEIVQRARPKPEPRLGEPRRIGEAPKVGRGMERLPALLVERGEVRGGEIVVVDASDARRPSLRFHGVELTVENLATRPPLARDAPTVLAGVAALQRSGSVSVFATADPRAQRATFAGRGRLRGLAFEELADLVAARADVAPDRGLLHMDVRFRAEGGRIAGSVRPIVEGAGTRPNGAGLAARLRSMIADDSLDVFEARISGSDPEATTIPIRGTVEDPAAQALPMVFGVLRNAFVQGLTAALEGPPPPASRERAREQARRGLADGHARERRPQRRAEP
jgi:hypothetical protein